MAGFRLATISAALSTLSFMSAPMSTAAEDTHDTSFMQQFSIADFHAIPKQKFAEMAAGAAQCAVHGLGCGPQVDEFESLLQLPKVDAEEHALASSGGRLRGAGGRLRGAAGSKGGQKEEPASKREVNVALSKDSADNRQGKVSTGQAINLAMEQNGQVGDLLRSAVQQEEEATQEAADGKLAKSTPHGILRRAFERNAAVRQALQSAAQVEGAALAATREANKGKRGRSSSQVAISAALEHNAHLSYALRSAVQQEEAAVQEATQGHRVGAEHNGKLNHGFIFHAMQLDEKVSQALQSAVQGQETVAATAEGRQRKPTAQEAMEREF